jgi:hypothetical protein
MPHPIDIDLLSMPFKKLNSQTVAFSCGVCVVSPMQANHSRSEKPGAGPPTESGSITGSV